MALMSALLVLAVLGGFLLFPVVVIGFGLLMGWNRNDYERGNT